MPANPGNTATLRLDAEPICAVKARKFAVDTLAQWGLERFDHEVAICTTELAANAVLHSRRPFTVAVRPAAAGVRIDLQDERPGLLPQVLPQGMDPLTTSTTGRGLRLVASLASRWGFFTTEVAKTVWVELQDGHDHDPVDPTVELANRPEKRDGLRLRFLGLPVREAVASGVQIDDLVRGLQLQPELLSADERDRLFQLLDLSAPARLTGRQAAFRAAAGGLDRYDLELRVTPEEVGAVAELGPFLEDLAGMSALDGSHVAPEVTAMRAWLAAETQAQLVEGSAPKPYGPT